MFPLDAADKLPVRNFNLSAAGYELSAAGKPGPAAKGRAFFLLAAFVDGAFFGESIVNKSAKAWRALSIGSCRLLPIPTVRSYLAAAKN